VNLLNNRYEHLTQSILEIGKMYRYIGPHVGFSVFTAKEAAGSYPHTSPDEECGMLTYCVPFLVVAIEPFKFDDYDDDGNELWEPEFIKILTADKLGWINIDVRKQTDKSFQELSEQVADEDHQRNLEKATKTIGGRTKSTGTIWIKSK